MGMGGVTSSALCSELPPSLFLAEMLLKPEAEPLPAGLWGFFRRREQPQTAGKFAVCYHLTIASVDSGS